MRLQYSVHPPTEFMQTHQDQLLPSWSMPVLSVLIVLQPCPAALLFKTTETEGYKQQLRQQFLEFAHQVSLQLWAHGYLADRFDPMSGWPMASQPGSIRLDDVAVVHSALGYPMKFQGGCFVSIHPEWGSAVYPSILVTSAPPTVLEAIVNPFSDCCLPTLS